MMMPTLEDEALLNSIDRLKREQKAMKDHKKKLTKDLRNAEKRRSRLKKRARQLSDADLVAVLQMRGSLSSSAGSSCAGTGASGSSDGGAAPPSRDPGMLED